VCRLLPSGGIGWMKKPVEIAKISKTRKKLKAKKIDLTICVNFF
jgi:hypothetical protein